MEIREEQEYLERKRLSLFATLSSSSKGRQRQEEPCVIRTVFQRDRDRIIHSKSFRRLKHKTQVFIAPEGDHYRTRLTHTLEVDQIGRTISRALRLNEDLTEAIALGHDLGHTPFGHAGEEALNKICPYGFQHHEQSLRVVEIVEKKGCGLNLTWEVRDGIVNHPTAKKPHTLEGEVIRIADKIAYINHDIDDALRGKILKEKDLPKDCLEVLGTKSGERIHRMICNIVEHSYGKSEISMSDEFYQAMKKLRKFLFNKVYIGSKAKEQEEKAKTLITELYHYFVEYHRKLPKEYLTMINEQNEPIERVVCDYIAGMTDTYSITLFQDIFVPKAWNIY